MAMTNKRAEIPTSILAALNESFKMVVKSKKSPSHDSSPPVKMVHTSYSPKYPAFSDFSVYPSHWGWMKATMFRMAKQIVKMAHTTVIALEFLTYCMW